MIQPAPITQSTPNTPQGSAWSLWLMRFVIPWGIALLASFLLDHTVAQWMYDWRPAIPRHFIEYQNGPISRNDWLARVVRWPGDFRFTLVVAAALLVWHRDRWKAAGFLLLCGIASGSNSLVKWVFGRARPFRDGPAWDLINGGWVGMFQHIDVSFPSGHTALAFASAAALATLLPACRGWFYVGAALVGAERISENAHYLSDVVAGALLGVVCCRLVLLIASKIGSRSSPAAG